MRANEPKVKPHKTKVILVGNSDLLGRSDLLTLNEVR